MIIVCHDILLVFIKDILNCNVHLSFAKTKDDVFVHITSGHGHSLKCPDTCKKDQSQK